MKEKKDFKCLVCRSKNLSFVRKYRADSVHGKALFGKSALYICDDCTFVQVLPVPKTPELSEYYAEDYRYGGRYGASIANIEDFPKDNLFYLNRGESIAELVTPHILENFKHQDIRILDIGTGFGHILYAFGRRFPKARKFAIEISEVCIKHLKSIGIEVIPQPAEEILPALKEKFDVIILSHVLEHLANPSETIGILRKRLSRNGVLYVEVPNITVESLTKYPDNKWAPRVDEPHISFFTIKTLTEMLQKQALEVQFCNTGGANYKYISGFRFRLPKLQPFILDHLPKRLFFFLRNLPISKPLKVQERENSFYEYGGFRLWIRSVSVNRNAHGRKTQKFYSLPHQAGSQPV